MCFCDHSISAFLFFFMVTEAPESISATDHSVLCNDGTEGNCTKALA